MHAFPQQWRTAAIAGASVATQGVCARVWVAQRKSADLFFSSRDRETRLRGHALAAALTIVRKSWR